MKTNITDIINMIDSQNDDFIKCLLLFERFSNEYNGDIYEINVKINDYMDNDLKSVKFEFDVNNKEINIEVKYTLHRGSCICHRRYYSDNTHYITLCVANNFSIEWNSMKVIKKITGEKNNDYPGQLSNEFIRSIINDSITEYIKQNNLEELTCFNYDSFEDFEKLNNYIRIDNYGR